MKTLLLTLTLFVGCASGVIACPTGSAEHGGVCWYQERKTDVFTESKAFCESKGRRLPSKEEATSLMTKFKDDAAGLGKFLVLKGIPLFWTSNTEGTSVVVITPGNAKESRMDPTSKLRAQCVSTP